MTARDEQQAPFERLDEMLADGPVELIKLTDEELVAAEQAPEQPRLAVTPYLDRIEDDRTRQLLVTGGMRALVSRGSVAVDDPRELRERVRAATADGGDDEVTFDLRYAPDLDLALNLRAGADRVVVVEQHAAGDVRDWHYAYAHGERFCLMEAVTAAGQRTYTLLRPADATRHLAGLADPLGNASTDGEPQAMDAEAVADGETGPLAPVLQETRLITQVMEVHPRAESESRHGRLSVGYLTRDALWLVESDPRGDARTVTVRTLGPHGLHRVFERALHG